jgi:hypothetical protein
VFYRVHNSVTFGYKSRGKGRSHELVVRLHCIYIIALCYNSCRHENNTESIPFLSVTLLTLSLCSPPSSPSSPSFFCFDLYFFCSIFLTTKKLLQPSQRDCLGCFNLGKRRRKQRALTMNISCYHQL